MPQRAASLGGASPLPDLPHLVMSVVRDAAPLGAAPEQVQMNQMLEAVLGGVTTVRQAACGSFDAF